MNIFDKTLKYLKSRFKNVNPEKFVNALDRMSDLRGASNIPDLRRLDARREMRLVRPNKDHQSSLLFHVPQGSDLDLKHRAYWSETEYAEPRVWEMNRESFLYEFNSDDYEGPDVMLNPIAHGCGGSGPCVPVALHGLHNGSKSLGSIVRDLKRIAVRNWGHSPGHLNINPLNFTPSGVLDDYLDLIGVNRIEAPQEVDEELDFPGYFAELAARFPNSLAVLTPEPSIADSSWKHAVNVQGSIPVESKIDNVKSLHNDVFVSQLAYGGQKLEELPLEYRKEFPAGGIIDEVNAPK